VGSLETVRRGLQDLVEKTGADELIMAGQIFDHKARLRSFEIAAQAAREVHIPTALAA
jgi:alkanesulfonate monooxygenase SsuD/methylene tetrahydromethanopterin reductase-like flavin-dependent oxidoreductase (luciferase family)